GEVLADNKRSFCVALLPQDIKDKHEVFRFLAEVLNIKLTQIEARYKKNRVASFSPVIVARDIVRQQAIKIEENAYQYPGLLVIEDFRRQYPFGAVTAHATGYVGRATEARMRRIEAYGYSTDDPVGYSGVEEYYDDDLRGAPGGRQIQVNSRGKQVRLLSMRAPADGRDLVLTIDIDIQQAAYEALGGRKGSFVAIDPANGEVLALVSSPSFDPNDFSSREDRSQAAAYLKDDALPLLNRAVSAQFPPGSVFKIPVAAGGLQERKIKEETTFDCPGYFDLGKRRYKFPHAYGAQDLIQAIAHSANEYFFHIGLALGPEVMLRYASLFALGERTGIDLPYEVKGSVPRHTAFKQWFRGDTANMSIGQGYVLVTPVQLARLMAAVENEGQIPSVHLKKSLGGVENAAHLSSQVVVLRPEVWGTLKKGLHEVVMMDNGTAHVLNIPGIEVYGKTGTAQAGSGKDDHASFAGVVKTPLRTFAFVLLLENGGSSANACLAVKEMLLNLQSRGKIGTQEAG
ncbi:MAG: penicillin-binding transpeptidase domain-containing protein, partial [Candidatus Omnitrophota bacterium]